MAKKPTVAKLKKKLDSVFSKYIRARDCIRTTGSLEYGVCCTCGETKEYSKLQCGHFASRRYNSTRFDETNTAAQCIICNMYDQGRQYEFGKYIDARYGQGYAELIMEKSRNLKQFKVFEIQEIIDTYTERLKEYQ